MKNIYFKKQAEGTPYTYPKAILDGALIVGVPCLATYALCDFLRRRKERKILAGMQASVEAELAKADTPITDNFFQDRYTPTKKQAAYEYLPQLATLAGTAGLSAVAANMLAKSIFNHETKDPMPWEPGYQQKLLENTPDFALRYKERQQENYAKAVKLLRAVTDEPTLKDLNKKAQYEKYKKQASVLSTCKSLLATLGIGAGAYMGYRALKGANQELERQKSLRQDANRAYASWLAAQQDNGAIGKDLRAFIERNTDEEDKQLRDIFNAYAEKYSPKNLAEETEEA